MPKKPKQPKQPKQPTGRRAATCQSRTNQRLPPAPTRHGQYPHGQGSRLRLARHDRSFPRVPPSRRRPPAASALRIHRPGKTLWVQLVSRGHTKRSPPNHRHASCLRAASLPLPRRHVLGLRVPPSQQRRPYRACNCLSDPVNPNLVR